MTPLHILFQDEYLVAIDKPAGMLVHPGREPEGNEFIAMKRLRDELGKLVYPIHRLDRPTSGVLLFALDKKTAGIVQQNFELRKVEKTYQAIVTGKAPSGWICETPLSNDPTEALLTAKTTFERLAIVERNFPHGASPITLSLLKATPYTGRFHQIRRHLLESGYPIVCDFRYAGIEESIELGEMLGIGTRMLLQAKSLKIDHPHSAEKLHISAPTDAAFLKVFPDLS
ncbi:pseudouridine synthase [Luteolibacter sp. AS25]|uniref:pseudouridine synthase n=1 Tax=Luteolibacter sp. AS25 TaxID=3135776 RepID=UPI00398B5D4C